MTGRLQGKRALIVGAARGIGRAIAERFVEEGARVTISDVSAAGAATAEAIGADFVAADIATPEGAEAAVAAAVATHGGLDILVQNAGIYPWTLIEDISPAEWDAVLGVNLRGTFMTAKAALGPMRAAGGGRMVFTSSITGPRVTSPGHGHYSASKAGIVGFVRSAALEWARDGITVNAIEPGNILTEGMKEDRGEAFIREMSASVPLGRLGTPREIAHAALFLASEEAAYITGTTIVVDGGQILPEGGMIEMPPR
ncbi:SDR family oxidoreductase [Acuticoccus sp. M5D2P5]|uniref:SDR family oxidoreductase n=1 Tax=Acuticoccus kalidii TaxID=2910977 RepID=UPI001F289D2F|nr:SDR family NAD(P)-dependent oxidoreductase [Acuticoccus kalidii]MCF3935569.1 SDR family oxidoreductase [Acuticoccus kalidii]